MRVTKNQLKLSIVLAITVAVAFGVPSAIAIKSFNDNAKDRLQTVLETSLQARVQEVDDYTRSGVGSLKLLGSTSLIQEAVGDFSLAFHALGQDPTAELQRIYITENPHDATSRDNLVEANDGSEYSRLHGTYHAWLRSVVQQRDYYDLFLIDSDGNVVYTVFKEDDLGTNLLTGPLKDTPIANVYRKAINDAAGGVSGSAFARYAPSNGIPAAFQGTPLYLDGRVGGALLVQLRLDPFNQIMLRSHDLGDSFESYIVNEDSLMLSQSRFVEDSIFTQRVDTPSVERALSGATGFGTVDDYRGLPVLSAYQPYNWTGGTWAVLAEFDVEEFNRDGRSLRLKLMIVGLLMVVAAGLLGWFMAARD